MKTARSNDSDRAHGCSIKTSLEGNKAQPFIDNRPLSNGHEESPEEDDCAFSLSPNEQNSQISLLPLASLKDYSAKSTADVTT